jgi:CDP-glycerol glycerophosphotransferase (TagB/SpsB family)
LVFKAHPTNIKSAKPLREVTQGADVYWSSASVHDLIAYSDAVYVINSGVGFEALLQNKPVVTFGRVEYDAVSIHGDLRRLDRTWEVVRNSDPFQRIATYKKFVDWYCRRYCVDLSDPKVANARLSVLVEEILTAPACVAAAEPKICALSEACSNE